MQMPGLKWDKIEGSMYCLRISDEDPVSGSCTYSYWGTISCVEFPTLTGGFKKSYQAVILCTDGRRVYKEFKQGIPRLADAKQFVVDYFRRVWKKHHR